MTIQEQAIEKIRHLPEPLVEAVNDFVDFLIIRHDQPYWRTIVHDPEDANLAEAGMTDYAKNLEDYEERLSRGDIAW